MDGEVQASRVAWIQFQARADGSQDLFGARLWLAGFRPLIPGPHVHEGFGVEHGDVGVLGKAFEHGGHGRGVGLIEGVAVRRLGHGIARTQCLDEGLFHRARTLESFVGLRKGLPGSLGMGLVHHGVVDVGTVHEGDAPPGHGQLGVQPGGLLESADGLVMVEGVGPDDPLIESTLGAGDAGGDPTMVDA